MNKDLCPCGTGTYPTKIPYEISEDFETKFLNFSEGSIGETTAEEKFRKFGQNGRNIDGNFSWIGSGKEYALCCGKYHICHIHKLDGRWLYLSRE